MCFNSSSHSDSVKRKFPTWRKFGAFHFCLFFQQARVSGVNLCVEDYSLRAVFYKYLSGSADRAWVH